MERGLFRFFILLIFFFGGGRGGGGSSVVVSDTFKRQIQMESYFYTQCLYIYINSGTVLNTLKQSRINIMRGKKGRNYM